MEKSTYDICTNLVSRHKELKNQDITKQGYGQDDDLYNSLDELEKAIKKFDTSLKRNDEGISG